MVLLLLVAAAAVVVGEAVVAVVVAVSSLVVDDDSSVDGLPLVVAAPRIFPTPRSLLASLARRTPSIGRCTLIVNARRPVILPLLDAPAALAAGAVVVVVGAVVAAGGLVAVVVVAMVVEPKPANFTCFADAEVVVEAALLPLDVVAVLAPKPPLKPLKPPGFDVDAAAVLVVVVVGVAVVVAFVATVVVVTALEAASVEAVVVEAVVPSFDCAPAPTPPPMRSNDHVGVVAVVALVAVDVLVVGDAGVCRLGERSASS
mmetsp:Transcript_20740/g.50720  ORF Transcript_20740/g.50720 Transcript_20740/m.50720 type:complete len:259 (+) Transcript_20740:209-985(+)